MQLAEPVFFMLTISSPSAMPPEVLNDRWAVVQPEPDARPEPVGPWAVPDWPPFRPVDPVDPVDPVEPPEPPELPEPGEAEPWPPELSEAVALGEEESLPPEEPLSLLPQAVRDRPAATATASREIFWTRMIPLKRYG
ncbi:hypothetical protein Shyhy01_52170 [Streptomyces hygroscopicus subsp. hygroscopicus]|nr:hypothetical protein Shyhy01_52170 [Streptomyces hygroscopicus subsp. hygroscopicus]